MGILTSILLFVFCSIWAAFDGDFSGLEAIGKFLLYVGLFLLFAWAILNPVVLVLLIIIVVLGLCVASQK